MKNYTTIILFLIFSEISFGQKKELLYDNWPTTLPTNDRSRKDLLENPELKYVPIGTTWDHRIITFFFQNGTADIAGNGERDAVRLAFTYWENATNLIF